jgi:outer membrane protein assembly factor BamB
MGAAVNAFAWRLALTLARALEPHERDAVCGDLIESHTSGAHALRSIAGLVARRQSTEWLDWHPWLALVTMAIPAGVLLSHWSRGWADGHAIYAFIYIQRWSDAYLENPGSRREMLTLASIFLLHAITLAAWSWTAGRALGALSRRTTWLTGIVFCLLVFGATVGTSTVPRSNNHTVFGQHFYAVVFPRLIRLVCVIAPALVGIYSQRRPMSIRAAVVAGAAVVSLTVGSMRWPAESFLPFAIFWPTCYLIAASIRAHKAMKQVAVIGLVALVMPTSTFAQASEDYTQWRGAQRDGSASSFRPPPAWPQSLTRRWSVDVGEGYATPLVVSETAFVFSRQNGREVMTSLDIATGAVRWQSGYAAAFTPSQPITAHGSGPKATPVYAGGFLFTQGISGIVSAFDAATGKILWQTAEPSEHPFFSAAVSPLVEGDLVIVHPGNYGPLTAFETRTGRVAWTVGGGGYFASPIAVDIGGTRQIVSATQDAVVGVTPRGELLWRHPWIGGNGSTTPVFNDGLIIVSDGNQVVGIRAERRGEQWVVGQAWVTPDVAMSLSNPVVVNDVLYGMSTKQRGQFFALDAKTGATLWLGEPRVATNTALVKAGELLFLLKDDSELIVARADRQAFQPIARYRVAASPTWAQPAISRNRILVKDVGTLTLWTVD